MTSVKRQWLGNAGLFLASVGVATLMGEVVVRVASRVMHKPDAFHRDASAGWTANANLDHVAIRSNGGEYRLSTDGEGHRLLYPSNEPPQSDTLPVTLLVGDSFVQGVAVEDTETFGWHLARTFAARRFVDLAVAGYGTDQELIQIERYYATHSGRVSDIVVVVFANDFVDVQQPSDPGLGRTKPAFHVAAQRLIRPPFAPSLWDFVMDHSRLAWLVHSKWTRFRAPVSPDPSAGVPLVLACLEEINRVASAHGARVHVFGARHATQPSPLSDSAWLAFLADAKAANTDSIRDSTVASYDKSHWNAKGHRALATLIAATLTRVAQ